MYPARSPEGLEKPDPVSPPAITLGVVERRRRGAKRRTLLVTFVLSIVRVIVRVIVVGWIVEQFVWWRKLDLPMS